MNDTPRTIRTADGHTVSEGARVFNFYDGHWGTILGPIDNDGWFDHVEDNGRPTCVNGERVCVNIPRGNPFYGTPDPIICPKCEAGIGADHIAHHVETCSFYDPPTDDTIDHIHLASEAERVADEARKTGRRGNAAPLFDKVARAHRNLAR